MSSEDKELEKETTKESTEVNEASNVADDLPAKKSAIAVTDGAKVESWTSSYRRVIAILPGDGKKGTLCNDVESSDDEQSDTRSEGVMETSTSSSEMNEGIPSATKPKVLVKRSQGDQSQASH